MAGNDKTAPLVDPAAVDFEKVYRDGTLTDGIAMDKPPWDTGAPEPILVRLEQAGRISGEVLDIGCGPGDNAVYLASRGYQVTGLDVSPSAIDQARSRAAAQHVRVEFAVADATDLADYDNRFDTVISSLLLHCLDPRQRLAHTAALARVTKPGGRLIMSCFPDDSPTVSLTPYPIGEAELRRSFPPQEWTITALRQDRITGGTLPDAVIDLVHDRGIQLEYDTNGTLLMAAWILEAEKARPGEGTRP